MMLDWSYRLSDFLLFSPRVYWRMFELHTQALWPLPLAILAVGAAMLALAILRPQQSGRLTAILLAVLWAWVGWSFVWERYATINWTAAYIAPLFAIEALLFLILGGAFNRLSFESRHGRGRGGILLVALALGYPLLAPLFGRPWHGAEVFGIAPDPTAIATLGFLLMARGRSTLLLYPIPLLWCFASGLTLWAMADAQAWILALTLAILSLAHAFAKARDIPN
ncbi:MAG: hypothetical protein C0484_18170 [Rhodospirillum sp.]|nr:hypothetical protein [Rhodospirillum sp.]